jgi:hypothetical protein
MNLLISSEQKLIEYIQCQCQYPQTPIKNIINLIDKLLISVNYLDINYVDLYDKTALLYACKLNSIALVQYLLTKFPNIVVRGYNYIDLNNWELDPLSYCIGNKKNDYIIRKLFTKVEFFRYYYEEFINYKLNGIIVSVLKYAPGFELIEEIFYYLIKFMKNIDISILVPIMIQNQIFEHIHNLLENKMTVSNFVNKYGNCIWLSIPFLNELKDLSMFKIKSPIHYLIENNLHISIKLEIIRDVVKIDPSLLNALYYFSKPSLITPLEYIIMFDLPNICEDIPDDETHQIKYDDIMADEFFQLFVLLLELGSNVEIQENFIEKLIQDESINQYKYLNILIKFGSNVAIKKIRKYKQAFKKGFTQTKNIQTKNNAITEANNAITKANNAITEANNATTEANNAITEANNAITEANNQYGGRLVFKELKMDIKLPEELKKININKIFKACIECKARAKFICDGCKLIRYCSRDCQIENWEHHRNICF